MNANLRKVASFAPGEGRSGWQDFPRKVLSLSIPAQIDPGTPGRIFLSVDGASEPKTHQLHDEDCHTNNSFRCHSE